MDSEKKKLMKRVIPTSLILYVIGWPLLMCCFDKVNSWKDALIYAGSGLILAIFQIACWFFGWIKPKKDE